MPTVICTALTTETGPHLEIFRSHGFEVRQVDRRLNLYDPATLMNVLRGCAAVLAGSEPYTSAVLQANPGLRVIARTGVGYDAIDLAACDAAKVVVTTAPGVNHLPVAEQTIAFLMALGRGLVHRDQNVRTGCWERLSLPRIAGRTLGICGLGRIGRAVATRALGLGLNVIACEPEPDVEFLEQWPVELVSQDELFARSDFLTLHCPAKPETRNLIRAETLSRMKRGGMLINTARGSLVDEAALVAALKSGHLSAAALDVFTKEPVPPESPLLTCPNLLLSNHSAGLDDESQHDILKLAAETIVALHAGKWPQRCIRNLPGVMGWSW